jgi:CHAD domain-containing protein
VSGADETDVSPHARDVRAEAAAATIRARVASRIADVMAARARVVAPQDGSSDEEAVHDYRVGLRRLRSALRALRTMWTKSALRPLEQALKELADATGDVRDEEVLEETLAKLKLGAEATHALATWKKGRARRLRGARGVAARKLAGPDLGGRLKDTLHAIEVALAAPPTRPTTMHRLAKRSVGALRDEVLDRAKKTEKTDVEGMHTLRIRIKRLRYGIELVFEGEKTAAALKAAAKLQKRLGELHDLDEAKVRVGRSWGLEKPIRHEIVERLAEQRHKVADKSVRDLDDAAPDLDREVDALIAAIDGR